jgi:hypothetical protein
VRAEHGEPGQPQARRRQDEFAHVEAVDARAVRQPGDRQDTEGQPCRET